MTRQLAVMFSLCMLLPACSGDGDEGGDPVEGDAVRGGQLYDKWWAVSGAVEPTTDHPLWAQRPDTDSNTRTGADTWRCKECHGWDYQGVDGAYASGSHRTGISGVLGHGLTARELVDFLDDADGHNPDDTFSRKDLEDLATFLSDGLIDTAEIIDASAGFKGTVADGEPIYQAECGACHGDDGLNPDPTGSDGGFEEFPGLLANDNPWEMAHKIRFGQPDTLMVAPSLTLDEVADLGAFLQTLPTE